MSKEPNTETVNVIASENKTQNDRNKSKKNKKTKAEIAEDPKSFVFIPTTQGMNLMLGQIRHLNNFMGGVQRKKASSPIGDGVANEIELKCAQLGYLIHSICNDAAKYTGFSYTPVTNHKDMDEEGYSIAVTVSKDAK